MTELSNIWEFKLTKGSSPNPRHGACLLDAVSWFEYGCLGDHPPCTAPTHAAYGRRLNDFLPDDERQQLKLRIPRLIGTVDPTAERERAEYAVRRTVRELLPLVLPKQQADTCAALSPTASMAQYRRAATSGVPRESATAPWTAAAMAAATAAATWAGWSATAAAAWAAATAEAVEEVWPAASPSIYALSIAIFDGMLAIGRQAPVIYASDIARANRSFAEAARH